MKNVRDLGQVFTPNSIVEKMVDLITFEKPKKILEPSSGDGSFYRELLKKYSKKIIRAIEIDPAVAHEGSIVMDYFDLAFDEKFDVIIGNPPYVENKNIDKNIFNKIDTKTKHKPNLYMLFLEDSLRRLNDDGELIFIIPVEWIVATSFENVLKEICDNFSIQYFEVIDENVWENAAVTTAIFKIKKGIHDKIRYYLTSNNKIIFGNRPVIKFEYNAEVKVGAASGNNSEYIDVPMGDTMFVTSKTERTSKLYKTKYESTKNSWIRKIPKEMDGFTYQIFVNTKTRNSEPFYCIDNQKKGDLISYDASVLCIYIDGNKSDRDKLIYDLNKLNWKKMGTFRNGRFNFTQSLLKGILNG